MDNVEAERERIARLLLASQRDALRVAKSLEDAIGGIRRTADNLADVARRMRIQLPDVGKGPGPCDEAAPVVE